MPLSLLSHPHSVSGYSSTFLHTTDQHQLGVVGGESCITGREPTVEPTVDIPGVTSDVIHPDII